jgi:predicted phosphodiesterase
MRIHVLSDLHLEFAEFCAPVAGADVVVLAGDIDVKGRAVQWALQRFTCPVVLVAGNHDFYGSNFASVERRMRAAARGSNVHVLENESVVIQGVRFLGATLWTDYQLTGNAPLAQWDALRSMNDFRRIRNGCFRKITPADLLERHRASRRFLETALAEPFEGKTVVVTHHAPCELSLSERFRRAPGHLNAAYASRLEPLMGPNVALWVHGHTHDSCDYEVYGTRVVCNPRGYAPDDTNKAFDAGLVVTLDTTA